MISVKSLPATSIWILFLLLAACGDGGSDSPSPAASFSSLNIFIDGKLAQTYLTPGNFAFIDDEGIIVAKTSIAFELSLANAGDHVGCNLAGADDLA